MTATMTDRHGRVAQYAAGCRCDACREAKSRYRGSAQVAPPSTDAAPVHTHLEVLRGHGMSVRQIAVAAGVSVRTLTSMIYAKDRPSRTCQVRIADAVLAVDVPPPPVEEVVLEAPTLQTLTDRANLEAFLRRIRRGRRCA